MKHAVACLASVASVARAQPREPAPKIDAVTRPIGDPQQVPALMEVADLSVHDLSGARQGPGRRKAQHGGVGLRARSRHVRASDSALIIRRLQYLRVPVIRARNDPTSNPTSSATTRDVLGRPETHKCEE
jgi:hypothetical protein